MIDTSGVTLGLTSAGRPVRYCNSCRKLTRNCAGSSSTGQTSSMTRWPTSRGRASPNAPRWSGGDFFESVPPADLYLLKFILHDWDDERAITILQRCRKAMTGGGKVAIVEMVVGEPSDPGFGALMDINMLAASPGQERSLDEYDTLLGAACLRRTAVFTTNSPQTVIEAIAA